MLAHRIPTILPDLTFDEALEITKIHSIAGKLKSETGIITTRPFRTPHHTISPISMAGGGRIPKPGEISLAHYGVLYLDELAEFKRETLEILRGPLEDKEVTISRVWASLTYPCNFMLIASMNPCPCGYYGSDIKECKCTQTEISRYLGKISGPLLDRIDIQVEVKPVEYRKLESKEKIESSKDIKKRVNKARNRQQQRYAQLPIMCNSELTPKLIEKYCELDNEGKVLLERAFTTLGLSARGYGRILKVARTIADLEGTERIETRHLAEAIQYREIWGRFLNVPKQKEVKMQTQIKIQNHQYPKELTKVEKPPQILHATGNLSLLQKPKIAIVGTRKNTEYGKKIALNFARKLSEQGYTIVSGLANGIDSYAHMGAMLGKGKTIAVLPCGFDNIFPKQNQKLYEEIIKNGGLAITEYAPNIKADKNKFLTRNRIVAGVSKGILVVEGAYRSGTSKTAQIANNIDIPVFCIPNNLDSGKGYTPNWLIKQGNILVTNEQDIINTVENRQVYINKRDTTIELEGDIENQYIHRFREKEQIADKKQINAKQDEISKKYSIYPLIKQNPIHINDIVIKSKKNISQVNYELTMLTVEGYVKELPGKNYIRM